MPVLINAEALPGLLKPGMTVFVEGASGEPVDLIKVLEAVPSASAGIHYVSCQIPRASIEPTLLAGMRRRGRQVSFSHRRRTRHIRQAMFD